MTQNIHHFHRKDALEGINVLNIGDIKEALMHLHTAYKTLGKGG